MSEIKMKNGYLVDERGGLVGTYPRKTLVYVPGVGMVPHGEKGFPERKWSTDVPRTRSKTKK